MSIFSGCYTRTFGPQQTTAGDYMLDARGAATDGLEIKSINPGLLAIQAAIAVVSKPQGPLEYPVSLHACAKYVMRLVNEKGEISFALRFDKPIGKGAFKTALPIYRLGTDGRFLDVAADYVINDADGELYQCSAVLRMMQSTARDDSSITPNTFNAWSHAPHALPSMNPVWTAQGHCIIFATICEENPAAFFYPQPKPSPRNQWLCLASPLQFDQSPPLRDKPYEKLYGIAEPFEILFDDDGWVQYQLVPRMPGIVVASTDLTALTPLSILNQLYTALSYIMQLRRLSSITFDRALQEVAARFEADSKFDNIIWEIYFNQIIPSLIDLSHQPESRLNAEGHATHLGAITYSFSAPEACQHFRALHDSEYEKSFEALPPLNQNTIFAPAQIVVLGLLTGNSVAEVLESKLHIVTSLNTTALLKKNSQLAMLASQSPQQLFNAKFFPLLTAQQKDWIATIQDCLYIFFLRWASAPQHERVNAPQAEQFLRALIQHYHWTHAQDVDARNRDACCAINLGKMKLLAAGVWDDDWETVDFALDANEETPFKKFILTLAADHTPAQELGNSVSSFAQIIREQKPWMNAWLVYQIQHNNEVEQQRLTLSASSSAVSSPVENAELFLSKHFSLKLRDQIRQLIRRLQEESSLLPQDWSLKQRLETTFALLSHKFFAGILQVDGFVRCALTTRLCDWILHNSATEAVEIYTLGKQERTFFCGIHSISAAMGGITPNAKNILPLDAMLEGYYPERPWEVFLVLAHDSRIRATLNGMTPATLCPQKFPHAGWGWKITLANVGVAGEKYFGIPHCVFDPTVSKPANVTWFGILLDLNLTADLETLIQAIFSYHHPHLNLQQTLAAAQNRLREQFAALLKMWVEALIQEQLRLVREPAKQIQHNIFSIQQLLEMQAQAWHLTETAALSIAAAEITRNIVNNSSARAIWQANQNFAKLQQEFGALTEDHIRSSAHSQPEIAPMQVAPAVLPFLLLGWHATSENIFIWTQYYAKILLRAICIQNIELILPKQDLAKISQALEFFNQELVSLKFFLQQKIEQFNCFPDRNLSYDWINHLQTVRLLIEMRCTWVADIFAPDLTLTQYAEDCSKSVFSLTARIQQLRSKLLALQAQWQILHPESFISMAGFACKKQFADLIVAEIGIVNECVLWQKWMLDMMDLLKKIQAHSLDVSRSATWAQLCDSYLQESASLLQQEFLLNATVPTITSELITVLSSVTAHLNAIYHDTPAAIAQPLATSQPPARQSAGTSVVKFSHLTRSFRLFSLGYTPDKADPPPPEKRMKFLHKV